MKSQEIKGTVDELATVHVATDTSASDGDAAGGDGGGGYEGNGVVEVGGGEGE